MNAIDEQFMNIAIELAGNSKYISKPNPSVGCVIVKHGKVVAEGWTQPAGEDHAEIVALKRAVILAKPDRAQRH